MSDNQGDNHPNILRGVELERLIDMSLGQLVIMVLNAYEENTLLVDPFSKEELTAKQLLAKSIQVAKWLRAHNISVGDSVSVNSENRIEFAITSVATLLAGATCAPLNPDYTPAELKHVMSLSKPKIVFCSESTIGKLVAIKQNHPYLRSLVQFGPNRPSLPEVIALDDIIQDVEEVDDSYQPPELDIKETVATILCSSGTTGLPKGVMCTHDNMGAFIDVGRSQLADLTYAEDPSDAMMGLTPFFHSFGFMVMFLNIIRGKKLVVIRKFNIKLFLDAIVKYKIRRLMVPPPVLIILLKNPLVRKYDLSGLLEIRSGAAALGKDMERELKQRFKIKTVSQSYGMTETTLGVLMNVHGDKLGSVGKIVAGMMVKVVNDEGVPLGPYQEGEVCFKGPLIMKGYVGNQQATAETIDKDGWLHTGDVAYYDDEQFFFIVDRLKELIKYKGFQVAPAEIESLLLTHPSIRDAAVVGLPDEDAGELPLAFVVKREGKEASEEEVKKFVADTLSHQKQLRGGVIFLNEIPRNPTGKILRRILRERAKGLVTVKSKL
ncbi:luciferin 4-monooxygenase-like [Euwallacea similis]|uniref:luciferin 4-monooxygenase-like n=1 Tax=Euwallacea similis TaxID=1736056 RepID=UPI00344E034C